MCCRKISLGDLGCTTFRSCVDESNLSFTIFVGIRHVPLRFGRRAERRADAQRPLSAGAVGHRSVAGGGEVSPDDPGQGGLQNGPPWTIPFLRRNEVMVGVVK
jgi:hypothetical protein